MFALFQLTFVDHAGAVCSEDTEGQLGSPERLFISELVRSGGLHWRTTMLTLSMSRPSSWRPLLYRSCFPESHFHRPPQSFVWQTPMLLLKPSWW